MRSMSIFWIMALLGIVGVPSSLWAESCTWACHKPIARLKQLHLPVKEGECRACHRQVATMHPIFGGKSFTLTATGSELCAQCHDVFGKKKTVHAPVKEGNCLACHKVHGATGRFLLDVEDDQSPLCMECHDVTNFKREFVHGPVAAGACTKCHNPHESSEKALLNGPVRTVCLRCHEDFAKSMAAAATVHPPVKDAPCTACHNPHSSAESHVLNKKMPELCIDCHAAVGKKLKTVKVVHKPLQQERNCVNCHAPHFSSAKGLLPADEQGTCFGCHGSSTLGKPPLRNIRKEVEGKRDLHGPIGKGACGACHDPHGSDFGSILKGAYPADFYAPYKDGIFGLCLSCHEKNLLRFADTTIYTAFRNGKENLHFVHVANKRKGRSCRACHEPHASDGVKLIGKSGPPFGEWRIPIRLELTSTGGSCTPGCHRKFRYDRDTPETYRTTDKK